MRSPDVHRLESVTLVFVELRPLLTRLLATSAEVGSKQAIEGRTPLQIARTWLLSPHPTPGSIPLSTMASRFFPGNLDRCPAFNYTHPDSPLLAEMTYDL